MAIQSLEVKDDPSSYTLENIIEYLSTNDEKKEKVSQQLVENSIDKEQSFSQNNGSYIPKQILEAPRLYKQKSLKKFKKKIQREVNHLLRSHVKKRLYSKISFTEIVKSGVYTTRNYYQRLKEQEKENIFFLNEYISKKLIPFLETEVTYNKRFKTNLQKKNPQLIEELNAYLGVRSYEDRIQYEELFFQKPKKETNKKNWNILKKQVSSLNGFNYTYYNSLSSIDQIKYYFKHTKNKIKHKLEFTKAQLLDKIAGNTTYLLDSNGKNQVEQFINSINIFDDKKLTKKIKNKIIDSLSKEYFYTPKKVKKNSKLKQAILASSIILATGIGIHESIPFIMPYHNDLQKEISISLGNTDTNTIYYAEGNVYWDIIANKQKIDSFLTKNLSLIERESILTQEEKKILSRMKEINPISISRDSPFFEKLYYNPSIPTKHVLDIINLTTKRDGTGITILDNNDEIIYQIPNMHAYLDEIPEIFKEFLIVTEDNQFQYHAGVNIPRTINAAYNYLIKGSDVSGNSTITQQLSKLLFYWNYENGGARTTIKRKIDEMLIAFKLEVGDTHLFDNKEEIIKTYFNQIYGGSTPYDIEARGLASIFKINYNYSIEDIISQFSDESLQQDTLEIQGEKIKQVAHFIASLKGPTTYSVNYKKFVKAQEYFSEQNISWEEILRAQKSTLKNNLNKEYKKNWNIIHNTNLLKDYVATENRIKTILSLSVNANIISQEQYNTAINTKLTFTTPTITNKYPSYYHHFTQELRDLAPDQETYELLLNSNLTFKTHLNPLIQEQLQNKIDTVCEERNQEITGGGIVVKLKNINGTPKNYNDDTIQNAIVALVGNNSERYQYNEETGSYNEGYSQIDNAKRSPGSINKIGLLVKAMEMKKSLENAYLDSEREYHIEHTTESGDVDFVEIYNPVNYSHSFSNNLMTLKNALAFSKNSIFLKLTQDMGVNESIERLNQLMRLKGNNKLKPVLSNAIGSGEVRAIDLINMPITIANMGTYLKPTTIKSISSLEEKFVINRLEERVIDEASAYETNYAAAGTVINGTLYNARYPGCNYRMFGKTGTSQNNADAKAIAWTYDFFSYVGFNRFDSNDSIPYKTDINNKILYDWRGNPIRMNGSHEPATIVGDIIELTNKNYDVSNVHLLEKIPDSILFADVNRNIIPISKKGKLNFKLERPFNLNYNDDNTVIIEKIKMPFY